MLEIFTFQKWAYEYSICNHMGKQCDSNQTRTVYIIYSDVDSRDHPVLKMWLANALMMANSHNSFAVSAMFAVITCYQSYYEDELLNCIFWV